MEDTAVKSVPPSDEKTSLAGPFLVRFVWLCESIVLFLWFFTGAIFNLAILEGYGGHPTRWAETLQLHTNPVRVATMAVHFVGGATINFIGPFQVFASFRDSFPFLHRWMGRIYVFAAMCAGFGGCTFILTQGCVGGLNMDLAFLGYGVSVLVCATQTFLTARRGDYYRHREWAMRLFVLGVGSWLYRLYYIMALHYFDYPFPIHSSDAPLFYRPLDIFFDWAFYVPILLAAEVHIRCTRGPYRAKRPARDGEKMHAPRSGGYVLTQKYAYVYLLQLFLVVCFMGSIVMPVVGFEERITTMQKERGVWVDRWKK